MNAEQVARVVGCSSKTVLRYVKRGVIKASYKNAQELEIAEDQIDKLRQALALGKSGHMSDFIQDMSGQIAILSERVRELEERVQTLESRQESSHVSVQSQSPPYQQKPSHPSIPSQSPQIPIVEPKIAIPDHLPPGTLHSTDFASQLGLTRSVFDGIMKNGIKGEQLDRVRILIGNTGKSNNYFTPGQQEQAIALLRKHGKI